MDKLDDKLTDELFKIGAERHDFTYDPAAWAQMEGLLNKNDRARRRAILFVGLLMLLGLGALTWWAWPTNGPTAPVAGRSAEVEAIATDKRPPPRIIAPLSGTVPIPITPPAVVRPNIKRTVNAGVSITEGKKPLSPVQQITKFAASVTPALPSSPLPKGIRSKRNTGALFLPEPRLANVFATSGPNRFAARLSAGTIIGQSETGSFERARPRLGVGLEYRMGHRLAISAAAFYNAVCYRAELADYQPDAEFWSPQNGVKPAEVTGECTVLEIPLEVRFYPGGSGANSLYFSGGATSYFLLKEEYSYHYDRPALGLKQRWDETMSHHHLFGMGHFSAGYQRYVRPRAALQVEAFVQLPISGIGHGNVRLLTTGLSLSYQFGGARNFD